MGVVTHALGSITHAVGGIIGDVTDTLGLTNHHAQQEANNRANLEANRAYGMSKAQLAFQKQQYADWKDLYGTMQEKQAHYVNNYSGANVVANQLQLINYNKTILVLNMQSKILVVR